MNALACASCLDIFEQVMGSALGEAFTNKIYELLPDTPDEINFSIVHNNLMKNIYSNPGEWIKDVEKIAYNISGLCGQDSELSYAAKALLFRMKEKSKYMFEGNTEEWNQSCIEFISALEENIPNIPNSISELPKPIELPEEPRIHKSTINSQSPPIPTSELLNIKNCIQKLISDEEVHTVVDIVSKYEYDVIKNNGIIEFDLKKCSPTTIKLIRAHLLQCLGPHALDSKPTNLVHRSSSVTIIRNPQLNNNSNINNSNSNLNISPTTVQKVHLTNPNDLNKNSHIEFTNQANQE